MDPSLLQLIVEGDPSAVSRSRRRCITLDTLSDSPIDPELVHGGCDLKVEEGVPAATRQHPVAAVGRKEDKSSSQSEGSRVNVGGGARGGGVAASAIASAAAAGGAGESAGSKRDVSPAVSKVSVVQQEESLFISVCLFVSFSLSLYIFLDQCLCLSVSQSLYGKQVIFHL